MYAIVDIETTGGSPKRDKITEIAIFIYDGEKIIDEFTTLINPERSIPPFITQLTGITNEMVEAAPKFYEIAKRIVEITDKNIFVAHNVNFDFGFIQSEFERLGFDYKRNKLCTIKLGRKLMPGKRSYSLENICKELKININHRHRAAGDALATVKLLEYLILLNGEAPESDNILIPSKLANINPSFNPDIIKKIPQIPGIYYFHNENNDIIYIGKSKNIKNRVVSHFNNNSSKRAIEMKNQIYDISYEPTGNELIALLMECEEIKTHLPKYNRALRRDRSHWGLFSYFDTNGYINLKIEKNTKDNGIPIICFNTKVKCKAALTKLVEKYLLCQKLVGLYQSQNACFHYQIGECSGACIGEEPAEIYNKRVKQALQEFKFKDNNLLIIDKGRHATEKSVVKIENSKYIGYGFVDFEQCDNNVEELHECISKKNDNHDIQIIIKKYLNNNKVESIITF